jgi:uridine kinase
LHIYTALYLAYFWIGPDSDLLDAWRLVIPDLPPLDLSGVLGADMLEGMRNLVFSAMVAAMAAMVVPMYLNGVRSNAVYRMRTRPMLIGLAGDSGAGKDTVCQHLVEALGGDRVLLISGDDYHRWPRGHQMWKVYTHLDVRANDLSRQHDHAIAVSQGLSIVKGSYDHDTGQFTEEQNLDPRQYVIFAGLHTLAVAWQRQLYELTIFLDPEESLRHTWKIQRDCRERGYSVAQVLQKIQERSADRQKYIQPQREFAEVVVRLRPLSPINPVEMVSAPLPPLVLEIVANNSFSFLKLAERLGEIDSLKVEHDAFLDTRHQLLQLHGRVPAEKVAAIARATIPNLDEIAANSVFAADLTGCMQLILLTCLSDKLRWHRRASDRLGELG